MAESDVQQRRRQWRLFSWGGALIFISIVVALNVILSFLPVRVDTSQGGVYSLSQGSKDLLKKLDDTLLVQVIFSSQLPAVYKLNQKYLEDLLAEYKRASHGKIRVEYFDPGKSPEAREQAINMGAAPVQLDVRERDRREVKECFMSVALQYGDKREVYPVIQDTAGLEYELTIRIKRLLNPERLSIGVVANGGGMTFETNALKALGAYIADIHDVQIVDANQPISSSIRSLWIIGPTETLEKTATDNIRAYLKTGGTLGLLVDQYNVPPNNFRALPKNVDLSPLLDDWGLGIKSGLVLDPQCDRIQVQAVHGVFRMVNVVDYPYFPLATDLDRKHPASKDLDGVSFPFVSPLIVKTEKPGITVTPLAKSSNQSYLEISPLDVSPLQNKVEPAAGEREQFTLALIAEGHLSDPAAVGSKPSRLILFGTSRLIQSEFPARSTNYALFVNLVDWSVQDEAMVQIRTKGLNSKPLRPLPDPVRLFLKYLMMGALPLLALILGIISWRAGKARRARLAYQYREA